MNRGYTDMLTGSMHLLDLPANALFKYVLKGRLPSIFLPSFLHESTHFWCGSSDLSAALAILELRSHRDALLSPKNYPRLSRNLAVFDATQTLLKPLLEGLALFMEFDASPGDSRVFAAPGTWASAIFLPLEDDESTLPPREKIDAAWVTDQILARLLNYRTDDRAVARKLNVLMQPLREDPDYYLLGYLAVKAIWLAATQKTRMFLDRDLFLSFVRSWIFQDWVLIGYVLDETISPSVAIYLISGRIQRRVAVLASQDLTGEATAFNEESDAAEMNHARMLASMQIKQWEAEQPVTAMRSLLTELRDGFAKGERKRQNWFLGDFLTIQHRQEMMRLAIEEVMIEVNEYNRVLVRRGADWQSTYLAGQAPPQAKKGTTSGWITIYFLPELMKTVILAVREDQPMLCVSAQGVPEDKMTVLRFSVTKVVATEKKRREISAYCRELAAKDEQYNEALDGMRQHVQTIYSGWGVSNTPEEKEKNVLTMLERRGFYELLGRDGDLLTALVHISLVPLKSYLEGSLREIGIDLEDALAKLAIIQKETGMPLVYVAPGDSIFSCA